MKFTARSIPYQQTGYFSRLISDYLEGNTFLRDFYAFPVSFEGIESAMKARAMFETDRPLLVKTLEEQYAGLPVTKAVYKNITALGEANTFTITTAHQPAIFTGNLYFIYKILHVIKIAETLRARYPAKQFVPVYYMGSEDADLDELGHIYLDNEKLSWDTPQTGAVGRMHTTGLDKIMTRIEGEFAGFPFGPELIQLLKEVYLQAATIEEATLKLLHQLFGHYGLVILIADRPLLKARMAKVFRDDLTNHLPFEITEKNVNFLAEKYPVQARPRQINLFYLKDDLRDRIDIKEDHYQLNKSNIRFTRQEILQELDDFPERFSPNVILRGLFQETILPNIAFVGGGGETAYWLELKPLFQHYGVPYPVLILRNSFLLIKRKWKEKMAKSGLIPETFFQNEEKLIETLVRHGTTKTLDLKKQKTELQRVYESLKNISGAVDKTLVPHVEKLQTQSLHTLVELEKKLFRAEKKNHGELRNKIQEIRKALFPLEGLQERIDNFIPWYATYGNAFIELIYAHSLSLEQSFTMLEEES